MGYLHISTISLGDVAGFQPSTVSLFISLLKRLETPVSPGALGHLEPSFFEAGRWVVSTVGAVVIPQDAMVANEPCKKGAPGPGCSFGHIRDYHKTNL